LITDCLLRAIQNGGPERLPWDRNSRDLQARLQSLHCWQPDRWPAVDDETLLADLAWLTPYLHNARSFRDLQKLDMTAILLAGFSWEKQQELERLAPSHLQVASGSRIRLHYQPGEPPVLPVRIQEMFGCRETPTVANGKIKVIVHLLSPAQRPIQVTSDLAAFWRNTYREVKKELAGRYPKHFWPDDPLSAKATSRAKPRRK
jgi:ATP-dependent helicase HrpB